MKLYFSVQWHITDDCGQRRKHCYSFSENIGKQPAAASRGLGLYTGEDRMHQKGRDPQRHYDHGIRYQYG